MERLIVVRSRKVQKLFNLSGTDSDERGWKRSNHQRYVLLPVSLAAILEGWKAEACLSANLPIDQVDLKSSAEWNGSSTCHEGLLRSLEVCKVCVMRFKQGKFLPAQAYLLDRWRSRIVAAHGRTLGQVPALLLQRNPHDAQRFTCIQPEWLREIEPNASFGPSCKRVRKHHTRLAARASLAKWMDYVARRH